MLVCSDVEGGSYELCIVPKDAARAGDSAVRALLGYKVEGIPNVCIVCLHNSG